MLSAWCRFWEMGAQHGWGCWCSNVQLPAGERLRPVRGVSWMNILSFHIWVQGQGAWISVVGKAGTLPDYCRPWSPAWSTLPRLEGSFSTFCHIFPMVLFPVGKPFYLAMGSLWAQVPQGPEPQLCDPVIGLQGWTGGQAEEAGRGLICNPPSSPPEQCSPQGRPLKSPPGVWGGNLLVALSSQSPFSWPHWGQQRQWMPQDDDGILVHSGMRCLLRAGIDVYQSKDGGAGLPTKLVAEGPD